MKKLLPKDFESLLKTSSLTELQDIFKRCDLNARGGYSKQTAIAFNDCPDELTRWLVEQGADLSAQDNYNKAPLQTRASCWNGNLAILLELGARIDQGALEKGTALHFATAVGHVDNVKLLIEKGANVDAVNRNNQSPLAYALESCSNIDIKKLAGVAPLLLDAGACITIEMRESVTRIGKNFEFHRAGFNKDSVETTSEALHKLYGLFDVTPVAQRILHDGTSAIIAHATSWQERHQELWHLLVPSSGAASTAQGEVIRISGRICREVDGNGGVNWDEAYSKMAKAFLKLIGSGNSLTKHDIERAESVIKKLSSNETPRLLCELAVAWVSLNPDTEVKEGIVWR